MEASSIWMQTKGKMGEAQETSPLFSRLAQYKHSVKGTVKTLIKASL